MPKVSIIVPCFNEEKTIELLLEAIRVQDFPISQIEVIIADGLSVDSTRERIRHYQQRYPELSVKVIDNPNRNIPSGLNCAIRAAQGEYLVRLDAHSMPADDYVSTCVKFLEAKKAENVGGIWEIQPGSNNWRARSIAWAAAHPIGVGDAQYRHGKNAMYVDTVPFGAFRRGLFDEIGLFNESLLTNEDYELNVRIRKAGGKIWFDPSIRSVYFAREAFKELSRQYFRYGYWKSKMLRMFPDTLRWRQALPPLFVAGLIFLLLFSPFFVFFRYVFLIVVCLYLIILCAASLPVVFRQKELSALIGVPVSIVIMHLSWGMGFLWGVIKSLF